MDAIVRFAEHAASVRYEDLPGDTVSAAETFILDTVGVGFGGSSGPMAGELAACQAVAPAGEKGARVWSHGRRVGPAAAALCNAYQVHNAEFDCLHEGAVAHVMSAVVPAAMAEAEAVGRVDGRRFIAAVAAGVDIASNIGLASASGLRFFRPATVGAFGAAAAVGNLRGFDRERMVNALSFAYGQLCGTMQAHEEGSMLLAMQVGFNARNGVVACDLAGAGFSGPLNVLEGRFGFYRLFEAGGDPQAAAATLGEVWRVMELAHKPFPSGRATHGLVDACLELARRHGIRAEAIASIEARAPALISQLVGRPPRPDMDTNYARLCARYVAARALLAGTVALDDFTPEACRDETSQRLAAKIAILVREDCDPHKLVPIGVTVEMEDGARHEIELAEVYGAPGRPMSREAQLEKFRANCRAAARPLAQDAVERLITTLSNLRDVDDVGISVADVLARS